MPLMIVLIVDQDSMFFFKRKRQTPVSADSDCMMVRQLSGQRMQFPTMHVHVFCGFGGVQSRQQPCDFSRMAGLYACLASCFKERLQALWLNVLIIPQRIARRFDHQTESAKNAGRVKLSSPCLQACSRVGGLTQGEGQAESASSRGCRLAHRWAAAMVRCGRYWRRMFSVCAMSGRASPPIRLCSAVRIATSPCSEQSA